MFSNKIIFSLSLFFMTAMAADYAVGQPLEKPQETIIPAEEAAVHQEQFDVKAGLALAYLSSDRLYNRRVKKIMSQPK